MSASLSLTPPATTADDPKASVGFEHLMLSWVRCPVEVDGGAHLLASKVDDEAVAFEPVGVVRLDFEFLGLLVAVRAS